eukprot:jgi/Galph1/5883/GphlegSOOS_G4533.1
MVFPLVHSSCCNYSVRITLTLHAAVISKILLPWNTKVGCGAQNSATKTTGRSKVQQRTEALGGMPYLQNEDCTVLLVDDGLASGLTMTLAVEEFRKLGTKTIIVVVPTACTRSC